MDKLISPLLLVSTLMGLVILALSAVWLLRKPSVTAWQETIVPSVIIPSWWWIGKHGRQ